MSAAPPSGFPCRLLLFDLDGTLVDSARDLHAAAVALCTGLGLTPPDFATFRECVSLGGAAMLRCASPGADDARVAELLPRFLALYDADIASRGGLFAGMAEVLAAVEAAGARWGVVTNKPGRLARRLLDALDLSTRCAVLIGGDTLPTRKPDPAPLREACRRCATDPQHAVYVGDDPRDVEAARAAGMPAIAAAWGYVGAAPPVAEWGAQAIVAQPIDLLADGLLMLDPAR